MKCYVCNKRLVDRALVVPILCVVESEKHGDFVPTQPTAYAHLGCVAR